MTVFARQLATAKRLIDLYGASCLWIVSTDGAPANPAQPWKPTAGTPTEYPVKVLLTSPGTASLRYAALIRAPGTEVAEGDQFGLMAGGQLFVPKLKDKFKILATGETMVPSAVDPLNPDGTDLLYRLRWRN